MTKFFAAPESNSACAAGAWSSVIGSTPTVSAILMRSHRIDLHQRAAVADAAAARPTGPAAGCVHRAAVFMAAGYPTCTCKPHLDAPMWKCWLSTRAPFTVVFNGQGRVARVETDADTLVKVHLE